jgi:hypothetical protein
MTHRQIILDELARTGRTTYRALLEVYGPRGYTKAGFASAVRRLKGKIKGPGVRGGYIVRAGYCRCCGQAIQERA